MKKVLGILFSLLVVTLSVALFTQAPEIGVGLAFALPVCATNCSATLAPVSFDECNPETNGAQIAKIYVTNIGNPLVDWTDPIEWQSRLNDAAVLASDILTLHVIASKPVPAGTEKEISLGRKVVGKKTHILPFKIDETNITNHEFLRANECGGSYLFWYETLEGKLFGSTDGIVASMLLDMNIAESADDLIQNEGKMEWKSKFTEERTDSPLA
jgi:formylglycine-generating enzyme required for sulfatase activity